MMSRLRRVRGEGSGVTQHRLPVLAALRCTAAAGVRRVTLDGRIEEVLLNHRYATHVRSTSRNRAEPPDAVACRLVADLL